VHAACAAAASRPPASRSAPRPASHAPPFDSRQNANAFNQPLSFDTSKVKNMYGMFYVRSARALRPPSPESGPPRACRACASTASHPPASRRAPRPASPAPPFDSRQQSTTYNQPLSLNTSMVTNMYGMFNVRSARALAPKL
jgi:hypothetical protein